MSDFICGLYSAAGGDGASCRKFIWGERVETGVGAGCASAATDSALPEEATSDVVLFPDVRKQLDVVSVDPEVMLQDAEAEAGEIVILDILSEEEISQPLDLFELSPDLLEVLDSKEAEIYPDLPFETADIYEVGEPVVIPGAENRFLITGGMVVTADENNEIQIIPNGQVLFEDDVILCVGDVYNPCETTGAEAIIELPPAYKVYPGFIDSHNHPHYNALPLFEHPGSDYQCAADWRSSSEYGDWKDQYYDPNKTVNKCQLYQYGILRALAGGATTLQGVSLNNKCFRFSKYEPWILRQIDSYNGVFDQDKVKTDSIGVGNLNDAEVIKICEEQESGKWDRFIIHLSEGVQGNAKALAEFGKLQDWGNGCLFNPKSVFIHCSAFTQNEFEIFAQTGAQMVWSPSSNTDLYGWQKESSLDVPAAMELGIPIALGPDWYPSHGIGMIIEINAARLFSEAFFGGSVTAQQIFKMSTIGGAKAANLEDYIGRLLPGMRADITIIAGKTGDPFEPNYLGEVAAVFVDGKLYYGDQLVMAIQNVSDASCEDLDVCEVPKTICLPPTYDGAAPTYTSIAQSFIGFTAEPFDALPKACGAN